MPDKTAPRKPSRRLQGGIALAVVAAAALAMLLSREQDLGSRTPAGPEQLEPYTPSTNTDEVAPYVARPHSDKVTILPRAQPRVAARSDDASAALAESAPDSEAVVTEPAPTPDPLPAEAATP